jgi:hypothetical protein
MLWVLSRGCEFDLENSPGPKVTIYNETAAGQSAAVLFIGLVRFNSPTLTSLEIQLGQRMHQGGLSHCLLFVCLRGLDDR